MNHIVYALVQQGEILELDSLKKFLTPSDVYDKYCILNNSLMMFV